jgi:hypothetical protein
MVVDGGVNPREPGELLDHRRQAIEAAGPLMAPRRIPGVECFPAPYRCKVWPSATACGGFGRDNGLSQEPLPRTIRRMIVAR